MAKFLIDVNLPFGFGRWKEPDFIWQNKPVLSVWDDDRIWDFAEENDLTIVTKDSDFFEKIRFREPPPRVIWMRTGNMKFRPFQQFIERNWPEIESMSNQFKIVIVFKDSIEGIN